jgi:hypothetical protein
MRKEAQFLEGFFKKLISDFGPKAFAERPFETIFKGVGPILLWRANKLLGLLAFGFEAFGIGPSLIGKFIDMAIGAGKGKKLDLSDSNLKSASGEASGGIIDTIQNKLKGVTAADAVLEEILIIKGCIEPEDIITAVYVAKSGLVKTAVGRVGLLKKFLGLVTGGRRLGLANLLFGALKVMALGIIGVSAATGIRHMITGGPKKTEAPATGKSDKTLPGTLGPASEQPLIGTYYANDARDVEATIMLWLGKVEGFAKTFKQMRPTDKSIQQSPGFQRLLRKIEDMNDAKLFQIDKWKAFVGPSPQKMVKMVLPGAIYEPATKTPSIPKGVPKGKVPIVPAKPKEELTKLLSEVL